MFLGPPCIVNERKIFTGSGCCKAVVGRYKFQVEVESDAWQEMRVGVDVIHGLPQYRSDLLLCVMLEHSAYTASS